MQAAPAGDDWVVEALLRTAREALDDGAPEAAAALLARALSEPPAASHRAEVLSALGRAEALGPDPASAVEHLHAALAITPEREQRDDAGRRVAQQPVAPGATSGVARARAGGARPVRSGDGARVTTAARGCTDHRIEVQRRSLRGARFEARRPRPRADRGIGRGARHARGPRATPGRACGTAGGRHLGRAAGARQRAPCRSRALAAGAGRRRPTRAHRERRARGCGSLDPEGLEAGAQEGSHLGLLTAHRFLAELAYRSGTCRSRRGGCSPGGGLVERVPLAGRILRGRDPGQALAAGASARRGAGAVDGLGDARQYPGFPNAVVAVARGELAMARGEAREAPRPFHARGRGFRRTATGAPARPRQACSSGTVPRRSSWRTRSSPGRGDSGRPGGSGSPCGWPGCAMAVTAALSSSRSRFECCTARSRRSSAPRRCASWAPRSGAHGGARTPVSR